MLGKRCKAAREGLDHVRVLLRLAELELIDRERRMVEIRAPIAEACLLALSGGEEFRQVRLRRHSVAQQAADARTAAREYAAARDNVIAPDYCSRQQRNRQDACLSGARPGRLRGSARILTGRLFDDRGNRMSPAHSNKPGVRYRYYVSHAILQNCRAEAGSIARVPAPEIETLVRDCVRRHLAAMGDGELTTATADRDLIERHVARVIVKPQALEVCLIPTSEASAQAEDPSLQDSAPRHPPTATIMLAWTAAVKGIVHAPCAKSAMRPESRDALLTAIAKARG